MRIRFDTLDEATSWEGTVEEWFHWVASHGAVMGPVDGPDSGDVWTVSLHLPGYTGLAYIGTVYFVPTDVTKLDINSAYGTAPARAGVRETGALGTTGPVRTSAIMDA